MLHTTRITLRRLAAEPGYSSVVVLGLALAVAASALLLAYLKILLGADSDVPQPEQVARLETMTHTPGGAKDWINGVALVFHEHWAQAGVAVEASTRYDERQMSVRSEASLSLETVSFADPGIVRVFGLKALAGDIAATLAKPDALVIGARSAQRLFGEAQPLGRRLRIAGQDFSVGAVVAERAPGSVIRSDFLVSIRSPLWPDPFRLEAWESLRGSIYVRLPAQLSATEFGVLAERYFEQTPAYKTFFPIYGKIASYRGVSLTQIPLHGAETEESRRMMLGLLLSWLIITVLAVVNYVNLSVVRTLSRQREIGLRKALGAGPRRVAWHSLGEAACIALLAAACGLLLAWLGAPLLGSWLDRPLEAQLLHPPLLLAVVGGSLVLGALAGAYPAWVALRVPCAAALAGRGPSESRVGQWLRQVLSILQFATAMAMIALTLVVSAQSAHLRKASPGYDSSQVLAIEAPVDMKDPRLAALRDALEAQPGILAAGIAWDIPGRFKRHTSTDITDAQGRAMSLAYSTAGPGFFQSYNIKPLAGRVFEPGRDAQGATDRIVINASAARALGYATPAAAVGAHAQLVGRSAEIIGVIADIRQRSLREPGGGVVYGISGKRTVNILSVRSADLPAARATVQRVWGQYFPDEVLRIETVSVLLASVYDSDLHLAQLIGLGACIALGLAAAGLYALSAHSARRRRSEIVLRKLHGAGRRDIAGLMLREFSPSLVLGAALGLPLAWVLGQRYLAEFVDRAPLGPWPLLAAFLFSALLALLAAARHTWRAMVVSPAQALRVA